ncbi:PstS family phosphate ABC transporter substrate-binding protein [Rhodospira trueperi]|uniref:Phosphate transport system substrate-binding protein n=1 Tax=Rhodospira trueperi TaxID=69960 RepID=A0A1G6WIY0_9PROT|nr:substrate-binding domain-containing protein [Rhodospira trueperi]SDD65729.1 phosphate transport system substrate-binding protein [Rhodospira trueperi]
MAPKIKMLPVAFLTVLFCFGAVAHGPLAAAETEIRVGGTGGALAAISQLGEHYAASRPDVTVTVLPSLGSGGGIRAVRDRIIDIGVSGRPVREDEGAGSTLIQVPFARTAVALITSRPGGAKVTSQVLKALIADPSPMWPDGAPMHVILRPPTETDYHVLEAELPSVWQALVEARDRPEVPVTATDQENLELAVTLPGSLTTGTLLQLRAEDQPLYPVMIDGLVPSAETLASGDYPPIKDFVLVVRSDASKAAKAFVSFLQGEDAAVHLRALGAIPIR